MLDAFYSHFWYYLSLDLYHLVAIPCMSMFPFRFKVSRWKQVLLTLLASVLSGLLAFGLRRGLGLFHSLTATTGSYFENQITHLVSMVLFVALLYRGNFFSMLLTSILALSLAGQVGFVYGNLMTLFWKPSFSSGMIILRDILGYGTFMVYFLILRKFSNVSTFYLSLKDHLITVLIVFAHFTISCNSLRYLNSQEGMLLFNIAAAFATLVISFLLFRYTREYQRMLEQQLVLQNIKLSENALIQIEETAAQIRELKHELGNQFVYMEQLVQRGEYDALKEYLHSVDSVYSKATELVSSGNPIINAILNQKLSYARSIGIETEVSVVLPNQVQLDDKMLCSLLGNLLNNAIEACRGQESPCLKVDIRPIKSYLAFRVDNSVTYDVLAQNPNLHTTKENAENHGIGMKIIRRILEENNGLLHYEMSAPDRFTVQAMLYLPNTAAPLSQNA